MTDYLERLLEQRQDEDEEKTFVWKRTKVGRFGSMAQGKPQSLEGAQAEVLHMPEIGAKSRDDRHTWNRWFRDMRGQTAECRKVDIAVELTALERAVLRGKRERAEVRGQAGRLAQAHMQTGEAAEAIRVAERYGAQELHVMSPGAQRGLANLLDAAFERDARRYDGPLGLF